MIANIRDVIGGLIGKCVLDITQNDPDECQEEERYVCLMFDDGSTLTFPMASGFWLSGPVAERLDG